jgi:hypothetical protein
LTAVSIGYASPLDPTWITGIYDITDFDDVIVTITDGSAAAGPAVVGPLRPVDVHRVAIVVASLAPIVASPVGVVNRLSDSVRAPPIFC